MYSSLGIQGTGRKAILWMGKLEGVACLRRHLALSVCRVQSCSYRPEPSGVQARRAGKGPSSGGKKCLRHSSALSWKGSAARECVAGFSHSFSLAVSTSQKFSLHSPCTTATTLGGNVVLLSQEVCAEPCETFWALGTFLSPALSSPTFEAPPGEGKWGNGTAGSTGRKSCEREPLGRAPSTMDLFQLHPGHLNSCHVGLSPAMPQCT